MFDNFNLQASSGDGSSELTKNNPVVEHSLHPHGGIPRQQARRQGKGYFMRGESKPHGDDDGFFVHSKNGYYCTFIQSIQ